MWLILFLLIPSVFSYEINSTFELVYTGSQNPPGTQFKYALNENFRLFETSNLDNCKSLCLLYNDCRGIFNFKNNSLEMCYGLTDIRYSINSNYESNSYAKVYYHSKKTENNTISGYSINLYGDDEGEVYIDLNHNGRYDDFEPLTLTNNSYFIFEDLRESIYSVKQRLNDNCYQMSPGIDGFSLNDHYNITGDGYADIVLEYFDSNTGIIEGPYGGIMDLETWDQIYNQPASFSFVIGGNTSTFLSIPKGSYITLAFTDESVIDTDGDDIFIREVGIGGNEIAEISVSNDLENYEFLGYAYGNQENGFDLNNISFSKPVHAIKILVLDHGNGLWNGFDLSTVRVASNSHYIAPFTYNIAVPNDNKNIIFINHCDFVFECNDHCFWTETFNNVLDSESCILGCDNYNISEFNINKYDDIYMLYNYSIKKIDFYDGYLYGLKKYLYPEYTFKINQTGVNVYKSLNCVDCIEEALTMCSEDEFCKSISQGDNVIYFSNDDLVRNASNSFTLIKSINVSEFIPTTSMTTTQTTSPTLTDTTTYTTTPTITDTSTYTTTPTNTYTSTDTTTPTSTYTSTDSTSPTITYTSTGSTTITTTPTTTGTSTGTTPTKFTTSTSVEMVGNNYTNDMNISHSTNNPSEQNTYLGLSWQVLVSIILGLVIFSVIVNMTLIYRKKKKSITPNVPQIESRTSYWNPIYDEPADTIDEVIVADYHTTTETNI